MIWILISAILLIALVLVIAKKNKTVLEKTHSNIFNFSRNFIIGF